MSITIRPALDADYEAISQYGLKAFPTHSIRNNTTRKKYKVYFAETLKPALKC